MIEAAALLSGLARDWSVFAILLLMLLVNAGVAFWQEHKADNAIALLKQRLAARARVRRDGKWVDLAASQLVPGDIVRIALGNVVPADLKCLPGPDGRLVNHDLDRRSCQLRKGGRHGLLRIDRPTTGEMVGEVTATGMKTFFGKTAALVETAGHLAFQKAVLQIWQLADRRHAGTGGRGAGRRLAARRTAAGYAQIRLDPDRSGHSVALPAVLSVTLAVGATVLSHLGAIVWLAAIEELAGMDVLCSDKTGTLTQNQLTWWATGYAG